MPLNRVKSLVGNAVCMTIDPRIILHDTWSVTRGAVGQISERSTILGDGPVEGIRLFRLHVLVEPL